MRSAEEGSVREFLAEAEEILEAVAGDLLELESSSAEGDPDPEVVNNIFRGAHSLKGISAMFGFVQVTELSHKTETLLDALRMGRVPGDRATLDLLFQAVDLLKRLCARLAAGEPPEDPEVAAFVDRLVAVARGPAEAGEPGLLALGLPPETLQVLTEYEVHRIEETLKSPSRVLVRVRVGLSLESFDTDLEALSQALKACGEIISTLPSPDPSDEGR
ncbi:MAG: Hpt domain-containing protein, partial [Deferrisomatales bacterium]